MIHLSHIIFFIFLGFCIYFFILFKQNQKRKKQQEQFLKEKGIIPFEDYQKNIPQDRRINRIAVSQDMRSGDDRRKDVKRKENLSPHQKKIKKQADEFIRNGNILAGTQLLESIGLLRDAIDILAASGRIYDAAKILIRIGKHDRAGVLFSQYKKWDDAAECFYIAGEFELCANALLQGNQFEKAGDVFFEQQIFEKSGEAYEKAGQYLKANTAYAKAQMFSKAFECIKKVLKQETNISFSKEQIDIIIHAVKSGEDSPYFISILEKHGVLIDLILYFIDQNEIQKAAKIHSNNSPETTSLTLLSQINYNKGAAAKSLANMFIICQDYRNAGIVFSRLEEYLRAAELFEKAKEWDRAIECYRRVGDEEKALSLQKMFTGNKIVQEKILVVSESKKSDFFSQKDHSENLFSLGGAQEQTVIVSEDQIKKKESSVGDNFLEILRKNYYFEDLSDEVITKFLSLGKISEYGKNTTVLLDHETHLGFYLLLKGSILSTESPQAIEAPQILNEKNVFFNKPSHYKFQAVDSCLVFYLTQNQFDALMQEDGKLCLHFLRKANQSNKL